MLTLKLIHLAGGRANILECGSVEVEPGEGLIKKVRAQTLGGPREFSVGPGQEFGVAYVENAAGATTQVIK